MGKLKIFYTCFFPKICYNSVMQIWFIGRTPASQAGKAGSTPVICCMKRLSLNHQIRWLSDTRALYMQKSRKNLMFCWFFLNFLRTLTRLLFWGAVMQFLLIGIDTSLSVHSGFLRAAYWYYIPYTVIVSPVLLWFFHEVEIFEIRNHFLEPQMLFPLVSSGSSDIESLFTQDIFIRFLTLL